MTSNQQFWIAIVTLIFASVVTPLIVAFVAWLSKRNANEIVQLKGEIIELNGKLFQVGQQVDGKLEALLLATGARERAEGKLEEAEQERTRKLTATALLLPPLANVEGAAAALLEKTTIIAENTTAMADSMGQIVPPPVPPMLPDETTRLKWKE